MKYIKSDLVNSFGRTDEALVLDSVFGGISELTNKILNDVKNNNTIKNLSTYENIDCQFIDISDMCYETKDLLRGYNSAKSTNRVNALSSWDDIPLEEKLSILDFSGKTIALISSKDIQFEQESKSRSFEVISFDLYSSENTLMIKNVDYYFKDNKIYLLKSGENFFSKSGGKNIILKNIFLDYGLSESKVGKNINSYYIGGFSKKDYKDLGSLFTKVYLDGASINHINTVFSSDSPLRGLSVIDMLNADFSKKIFWDNNELTWFDFIISIPLSIAGKKEKLDYVTNFFEGVKPAYSNFIYIPELLILDNLNIKNSDATNINFSKKILDSIISTSLNKKLITHTVLESVGIATMVDLFYDKDVVFDCYKNKYDRIITDGSYNDKVDKLYLADSIGLFDYTHSVKDYIGYIERNKSMLFMDLLNSTGSYDKINVRTFENSLLMSSIVDMLSTKTIEEFMVNLKIKDSMMYLDDSKMLLLKTLLNDSGNYDKILSESTKLFSLDDYIKDIINSDTNENFLVDSKKKDVITASDYNNIEFNTDNFDKINYCDTNKNNLSNLIIDNVSVSSLENFKLNYKYVDSLEYVEKSKLNLFIDLLNKNGHYDKINSVVSNNCLVVSGKIDSISNTSQRATFDTIDCFDSFPINLTMDKDINSINDKISFKFIEK